MIYINLITPFSSTFHYVHELPRIGERIQLPPHTSKDWKGKDLTVEQVIHQIDQPSIAIVATDTKPVDLGNK